MNEPIETAEYDGYVYEKRSIAQGEFLHNNSNTLRNDVDISVGDKLFFIDPRTDSSMRSLLHNRVVTVASFSPLGGLSTEEEDTSYILCCFHRIIKFPEDVDENEFNSVFD